MFEGLELPPSHVLLQTGAEDELAAATAAGIAKVKGDVDFGLDPGVVLRVDFNATLSEGGFLRWATGLSEERRSRIEFVEDPVRERALLVALGEVEHRVVDQKWEKEQRRAQSDQPAEHVRPRSLAIHGARREVAGHEEEQAHEERGIDAEERPQLPGALLLEERPASASGGLKRRRAAEVRCRG